LHQDRYYGVNDPVAKKIFRIYEEGKQTPGAKAKALPNHPTRNTGEATPYWGLHRSTLFSELQWVEQKIDDLHF